MVNLETLNVTTIPLLAHSTHTVAQPISSHYFDYDDAGDSIYMMGWGSFEPKPITFDSHFGEVVERRVALIGQRTYIVLTSDEVMYE